MKHLLDRPVAVVEVVVDHLLPVSTWKVGDTSRIVSKFPKRIATTGMKVP